MKLLKGQQTVKDMEANDLPANLAQPAKRALANAGIKSLSQLAAFNEEEIKKLHGIGPDALKKIATALKGNGLKYSE